MKAQSTSTSKVPRTIYLRSEIDSYFSLNGNTVRKIWNSGGQGEVKADNGKVYVVTYKSTGTDVLGAVTLKLKK